MTGAFTTQGVGDEGNRMRLVRGSPVRQPFRPRQTERGGEEKEAEDGEQQVAHAVRIASRAAIYGDHIQVSRNVFRGTDEIATASPACDGPLPLKRLTFSRWKVALLQKKWSSMRLHSCLPGTLVLAALLAAVTLPAQAFFHNEPDVEQGRESYGAKCAACHGANLEGQPDWQSAREDGTYPAPPHDQTGHSWHHGDGMLRDYIRRGGQAVLDEMGVAFTSGMPGFGGELTDAEIEALLAYIKSTWPEPIRAAQEDRTRLEAAGQ